MSSRRPSFRQAVHGLVWGTRTPNPTAGRRFGVRGAVRAPHPALFLLQLRRHHRDFLALCDNLWQIQYARRVSSSESPPLSEPHAGSRPPRPQQQQSVIYGTIVPTTRGRPGWGLAAGRAQERRRERAGGFVLSPEEDGPEERRLAKLHLDSVFHFLPLCPSP